MAIDELLAVVPAPELPIEAGPAERWKAIENELKTKLPDDFREFGLHYGNGTFTPAIHVFNPFASGFRQWVDEQLTILREYQNSEGHEAVPYGIFPELPGLLPWGVDDLGNCLYWLIDGHPNDWPTVVSPRDATPSAFWRIDLPITTFLARVFSRSIPAPIWQSVFDSGTQITFTAKEMPLLEQRTYTSIYQLYEANGNKAGFWVKRPTWEDFSYCALVKSVGGVSKGPIASIESNPPVVGNFFENGKIVAENAPIRTPYSRAYRRVPPPGFA